MILLARANGSGSAARLARVCFMPNVRVVSYYTDTFYTDTFYTKANNYISSMSDLTSYQPPHPRVHDRSEISRCDVIGDLHGCYDELAELMEKLGYGDLLREDHPPASLETPPRLIFVGDIVDRGDNIIASLRLVQRLCMGGHALSVMGNHDARFSRWLMGRHVEMKHGITETIDEFNRLPRFERERWRDELIEFFSHLPWAIRIDNGAAIVAHAAWHTSLHKESDEDRIRRYTVHGPKTGRHTTDGFSERLDWAAEYEGPELVIFGHQVYNEPNWTEHAVGIDTGCVFGGALTALRYPMLELVQVPSRRARYELVINNY